MPFKPILYSYVQMYYENNDDKKLGGNGCFHIVIHHCVSKDSVEYQFIKERLRGLWNT